MNKRSFRLIFDRERGMLVAAGEHVCTQGKSSQGTTRARRRAGLALAATAAVAAQMAPPDALALTFPTGAQAAKPLPRSAALAANQFDPQKNKATVTGYNMLPQPNPLGGSQPFMQKGTVILTDANGKAVQLVNVDPKDLTKLGISDSVRRLVINQGSQAQVILNWRSFDIGLGYGVEFVQPTGGSALNYIRDANPSLILGSLKANGEVILQNGNGIIFGPNARVDTGRFIATSLNLAQSVYEEGLRARTDGKPVFNQGLSNLDAGIRIERGAEIRAAAGGDVLIFAPRIVNEGRIETPDGQTALAAGNQVYLMSSSDQTQRGLIVAVNAPANDRGLYTVEQGEAKEYKVDKDGQTVDDGTPDNTAGLVKKVNAIVAERGSINLVGLAIKQNGLLQATTAVKGKNGVIQLIAEQSPGKATYANPSVGLFDQFMGQVTFGAGSRTEVLPSADGATQLGAEDDTYKNNVSKILVDASQIEVQSGATLKANAGLIRMRAADNAGTSKVFNGPSTSTAIDTSRIVVESGAVLDVSGVKNVPLPMSRNQINGKLFAIELADTPVQRNGVLYRNEIFFDGRSTVKVGNVSGFYNSIGRTAQELATKGGTISLQAEGAIVADAGAKLDLSGGSVQFAGGSIRNSMVRLGNAWIPITQADPNVRYDELYTPATGTAVAGYVEGADAGSASFVARKMTFAADVDASVTVGPRQSGRTSGVATPKAGSLTFGVDPEKLPTFNLGAISIVPGDAPRPTAFLSDPSNASLGLLDNTLVISVDSLNAAKLGSLALYSWSNVRLAQGAQLVLQPGASLDIAATGGNISILGSVTAHSGAIKMVATNDATRGGGQLTLGSQAALDTSGIWADDRIARLGGTQAAERVSVGGGTVDLYATGSMKMEAGSNIDVSAGAWRSASASDTKGAAGAITLGVNHNGKTYVGSGAGNLALDGTLTGYGFSTGGTLQILGLPDLTLGASPTYSTAFFNDRGFSDITLRSLGKVTIASSFRIDLRLKNYVAGRSMPFNQKFATVQTVVDPAQRNAVSLTLAGDLAVTSSLTMEAGSHIGTEAGGSLTLSAKHNVTVAGELVAPGGTINLKNTAGTRGNANAGIPNEDSIGFYKDEAIWLMPSARLSVAGGAEVSLDRLGRRTGALYGGGTINLLADHGYVVAEAGSVLDLRGYSDQLYMSSTGAVESLSRSAGTLAVSTPEGFALESTMLAQAPGAGADGGKFSASVTLGAGNIYGNGVDHAYPTDLREIRLLSDSDLSSKLAGLGQAGTTRNLLTALGNGVGYLSAKRLEAAGFNSVSLKADDKITLGLNKDQGLKVAGALKLNAPVIAALAGSDNRLSASYVAIGNTQLSSFSPKAYQLAGGVYSPQASTDGDASRSSTLAVEAGLIEVYGLTALQGIDSTALSATLAADGETGRRNGEIRLIETAGATAATTYGALRFAGDLTLTAGQIYATTLSNFTLDGCNGCGSIGALGSNASHLFLRTPTFGGVTGSTSQQPLSALGSLTAIAGTIDHDGVLRQPFGEVKLLANDLTVGEHSITSNSGGGLVVPVGTTVNGKDWQYAITTANTPLEGLPTAKAVTFNGKASLTIDAAATVDESAGGTVVASEFVPGVLGSTDYLSKPGLYAVIPSYGYDFAPFDTDMAQRGSSTLAGQQIDITMAGSALAPGRYTLLPARYALLPGAVLVSVAADQGKGPLRAALARDDGSAVVTGSFTAVGSKAGSNPGLRVLVEPPSTYLAKSQQDVTSIGALLADRAESLDKDRPALPADAGRLALISSAAINWKGFANIDLSGSDDDLAGQLDISITNGRIAIVDDVDAAASKQLAANEWTLLSAGNLSKTNAGSLLIGGVRSGTDSLTLDVQTTEVKLLGKLSASEVILAALGDVTVAAGSSLTASGSSNPGNRTLHTTGDSALVMVSSSTDTTVARSSTSGSAGNLTVEESASLGGPAVYFDATGKLALSSKATISEQTSTLGLAATQLSIGAAPDGTTGTVLSGDLLESLLAFDSLRLSSVGGIDFYGTQTLTAKSLTLNAPKLRGMGAADDVVTITASQVAFTNTSNNGELKGTDGKALTSATMDAGMKGRGKLLVDTTPGLSDQHVGGLDIGPGQLALGFNDVELKTTGDVTFQGSGMLVAQKDVTVQAARVTATSGAVNGIDAGSGQLVFKAGAEGAHTLGEQAGHGAKLSFSGQHIEQGGWIEARTGQLSFHAKEGVAFNAGSLTSVAGFNRQVTDSYSVQGDAGRISVTADGGDVAIGGTLDVSGTGSANGGTIAIAAANGRLDLLGTGKLSGAAASDALGAAFVADVGSLAYGGQDSTSIDELAKALRTGKLAGEFDLNVRHGDLALSSGAVLEARRVTLSAEDGSLTVGGSIASSAPTGGVVNLYAGKDLTLTGTAAIDAHSTNNGANGGDVLLSAATGTLTLEKGAAIDASGDKGNKTNDDETDNADDALDGRIVLRASRKLADNGDTTGIQIAPLDSSTLTAGEIVLAGVRTYTDYTSLDDGASSGDVLGKDTVHAHNQALMDKAQAILESLAVDGDARVHLRPDVEIRAAGDFAINGDWDLSQAHYAGTRAESESGYLTVRAAGNLLVNGSISDGFTGTGRVLPGTTDEYGSPISTPTALIDGNAWSYRLVAGADLGSANLLRTAAGGTGDLTIGSDVIVRTTAGSIELAAGRDIVLDKAAPYVDDQGITVAEAQGLVYVAGRPSAVNTALAESTGFDSDTSPWPSWRPQFTAHGGRLELTAGNDVIGQTATEVFGTWFYHVGDDKAVPTAWWSAFDSYSQGIGSFGGGDVRVRAGHDIKDLNVVAPTSAIATSNDVTQAVMSVENGGDVLIDAGNDLLGGMYLLGKGSGWLRAGHDIGLGSESATSDGEAIGAMAPTLGLMDGQWKVLAGGNVQLGSVFSPTTLPGMITRNDSASSGRVFFTYEPDSSLVVRSTGGDVTWTPSALIGQISPYAANGSRPGGISGGTEGGAFASYAPPKVSLQALSGDLNAGGFTLYPSATGQLELYAAADVVLTSGIIMADQLPRRWPSVTRTLDYADNDFSSVEAWAGAFLKMQSGNITSEYLTTLAALPGGVTLKLSDMRRFEGIHANDDQSAQIHAGGSIDFAAVDVFIPKPAEITAGLDLKNLNYVGEHLDAEDVTIIKAGRNFLGLPQKGTGLITLVGPGTLEVEAGRQLDMAASKGFDLTGNQLNPNLPEKSASLAMSAGTAGTLDVDTFTQRYLSFGAGEDAAVVQQRRDALVIAVREALGLAPLAGNALAAAYDDALAAFRKLSPEHQAAFAQQQLTRAFASTYLTAGQRYARMWTDAATAAKVSTDLSDAANYADAKFMKVFNRVRDQAMMDELERVGIDVAATANLAKRAELFAQGFKALDLAGMGDSFAFVGDINLVASKINSWGGDVKLMAPGGRIDVGVPAIDKNSTSSDFGIVAYGADIQAMARDDFQVASQKVFSVGNLNDVMVWSSFGDIDNGRGSNTGVTAPPLRQVLQADGTYTYETAPVTTGSGIAVLDSDKDFCARMGTCNVTLTAVYGEILALDTLIRAGGRVSLAATVVKGADNIIGGSVVGAPAVVSAGGVAVSTPPPSDPSKNRKDDAVTGNAPDAARKSQLTVELIGLGMDPTGAGPVDEVCAPGETDEDCKLRRKKPAN